MALWVWRFVEGEPPHFFSCPPAFIYYNMWRVFGGKKG